MAEEPPLVTMTAPPSLTEPSVRHLIHEDSRTDLLPHHAPALRTSVSPARSSRGGRVSRVLFNPETTAEKICSGVSWTLMFVLSIVIFAVVFPRFVDKVVNPLIKAMRRTMTPLQIAAVLFAAHVILPLLVIVPFNWCAWLAGMVFPWWQGFLLVSLACAVNMALAYLLGRTLMHDWLERRIAKRPSKGISVALRALDMAGPWKVIALLRLGPFPYPILNYLLAVPKPITFWLYMAVSIPSELPGRAMQVYFGQNLGTIADLFRGRVKDPAIAAYNIIILSSGFIILFIGGWYANRALKHVQEEELRLEEERQRAEDTEAQASIAAIGAAAAGSEASSDSLVDVQRQRLEDSARDVRGAEPDLQVVVAGKKGKLADDKDATT